MAQEMETKNDVFCAGAIIMFFIGLGCMWIVLFI